MGCKNCMVADIFTFPKKKKYDTITFFENNFGIGGSLDKTHKLLKKLSSMLKNKGQILAIAKRLSNKKYVAIELYPVWKQKIGSKFSWIHFDVHFLSDLCQQEGFQLKILQGNQYSYLIRIVKII